MHADLRGILNLLVGCLMPLVVLVLPAQSARAAYPDRPVHLVVGFAAGGSTDFLARLVAKKLSEKWNQPVVVENRTGADGSIAEDHVAHSPPDGYTIAWITNSHTITPSEFKLNYDPVKSFVPITRVGFSASVLLVNSSLPVTNVRELIAYAKANPRKLNFGSSGTGAPDFLQAELLMQMAGIDMVNVTYQGSAPAIPALLSNEIQLDFIWVVLAQAQLKTGKVRALAVATNVRSPLMPELPTVSEAAGLPDFDANTWFGVLLPAGAPKEISDKLHDDVVSVVQSPEVQDIMRQQGFLTVAGSQDEMKDTIVKDIARWAEVLKKAGMYMKK